MVASARPGKNPRENRIPRSRALVAEVRDAQGGDIEVGPLAVPVEDAGLDDNGLPILRVQREVSRQREAAARDRC